MSLTSTGRGRVTLPSEKNMDDAIREIANRWGADVIRNSDGTELPEGIKEFGMKVYSTLCLARRDQKWIKNHPQCYPQKALITDPETAVADTLEIDLMKSYFREQFKVDTLHDPKKYFEVVDRTTGQVVSPESWFFDKERGVVQIVKAQRYHTYTVSFLVFQIWDTTSMYNHVTNKWKTEHISIVDPRQPPAREHLLEDLEKWLIANSQTDVVRLTSLAYHFTNNFSCVDGVPITRYRDWVGYHDCTSVLALEQFEKEFGYRLSAADLTNDGYMNDVNKVPTLKYRDWMDFIQRGVKDITREWVDLIHKHNRKAMMFYCDHWIGAEPYGKYFSEIGLDAIVNPCMSGLELRRIADIPVKIEKEVRLYPYLFPLNLEGKPSFSDGGDPAAECSKFWRNIRRAMSQRLPDRIGFGGYPSLAVKFPDFIEYVGKICEEFRTFHNNSRQTASLKWPFKVAILNCWGKLRSWIDAELNNWTRPYCGGVLECLSGMNVDVEFISFDDILQNGIPQDVNVIINMGLANTSWSGGQYWQNSQLVTMIRQWVSRGGAFVGIQAPSASEYQGSFFQLHDVLGVDKELGYSISSAKYPVSPLRNHFILEEYSRKANLADKTNGVFKRWGSSAEVLLNNQDNIHLAVNSYGKGRSVYLTNLAFSMESVRLLTRILFWASRNENAIYKWFSTNPNVECSVFPETGMYVLMNYSCYEQTTTLYYDSQSTKQITLAGAESRWFDINGKQPSE